MLCYSLRIMLWIDSSLVSNGLISYYPGRGMAQLNWGSVLSPPFIIIQTAVMNMWMQQMSYNMYDEYGWDVGKEHK